MKNILVKMSLIAVFASYSNHSFALIVEKNCDIPSHDYKSTKANTVELCSKDCETDSTCKSFTFISGWNKCLLKNGFKKKHQITLSAGNVEFNEKKERVSINNSINHDSTGKDMKLINTAKHAEECSQLCLKEEKCLSFTYIAGYSMCWLKSTKGRIFEKIFHCGVK